MWKNSDFILENADLMWEDIDLMWENAGSAADGFVLVTKENTLSQT